MSSNDRPTYKDLIEATSKGIEKVFLIQLKASEERVTNKIDDSISNHVKSCEKKRQEQGDKLTFSKKRLAGYMAGISATIAALFEIVRGMFS